MATSWEDYRKTLNLSPEDEEIIDLEKSIINAIIDGRPEICEMQKSVIAKIERAIHSPQISSIIETLKPLGYTLAIVKSE
ncbi:MAG: XRE family transcriptional regulator [Defluviitaleaceae bacterium]|nr:XRE family transcriptional regulator [Defluviitaleaceae bacterium]